MNSPSRWLLLALGLLLSGCAVTRPQVTSTSYDPQTMEIVGPANGESKRSYFLGVIPVYDSGSAIEATKAALTKANGDILINAVVDDERGFFLLPIIYQWQTIRVHGTAVRFKPAQLPGFSK